MTEFNVSLVQGLAAIGQFDEAMSLIDETIQLVETKGDTVHMPELLRLKGSLFVSKPQPCVADAELLFARSLELSRHQGARAWELRTAIDLAGLLASQGQPQTRPGAFAARIRAVRGRCGHCGLKDRETPVVGAKWNWIALIPLCGDSSRWTAAIANLALAVHDEISILVNDNACNYHMLKSQ
jgi:hypothetical protein